jgi:hypothetical protein
MHRLVTAVALAVAAALVPSTALAAPAVLPAVKRKLTASNHGCATRSYNAPMAGFVTVRDDGTTGGDWDLVRPRSARQRRRTAPRLGGGQRTGASNLTGR